MQALTEAAWTTWPITQFAWGGCLLLYGLWDTVMPGYETTLVYGPANMSKGWQLLTTNGSLLLNKVSSLAQRYLSA